MIDTAGKDLIGKTPTDVTLCTCGAAGLPGGDYDGPATVNYRGGSNSSVFPAWKRPNLRPKPLHLWMGENVAARRPATTAV